MTTTALALERMARWANGDDFFFADTLNAYARLHDLDDTALAGRLGIAVEDLPALRLCRNPDSGGITLETISKSFGVDLQVLTEIVHEVREWPR